MGLVGHLMSNEIFSSIAAITWQDPLYATLIRGCLDLPWNASLVPSPRRRRSSCGKVKPLYFIRRFAMA